MALSPLTLYKAYKKDPTVASISPSSRISIRKLCKNINFSSARVIVEYGPGTGVFTAFLLKNLHPDARLFVFETNAEFVAMLQETHDPRLTVVHTSAEYIEEVLEHYGVHNVDYVISGIPFSIFPETLATQIVASTKKVLGAQGKFLVYQFSSAIENYLHRSFLSVDKSISWQNIPPLKLYVASQQK